MEAYFVTASRFDRPAPRRARHLPPHAARRERRRLPQPDQDLVAGVPRGVLLQAARRLRAPRAATVRACSRRAAVSAARSASALLAGDEARRAGPRRPGSRTSSAGSSSSSSSRTTASPTRPRVNPSLVRIARELDAPLLATNDSHYTRREDAEAHDALLCVQTGSTQDDPNRLKFEGQEFYLKSAAEMRALFSDYEEACDNTLLDRRARRPRHRVRPAPSSPSFATPEGHDEDSYLRELTLARRRRPLRRPAPDQRWRSASSTSSASSRRWGSRRTSSSCGTSSATPGSAASGSAPAGAAPPGPASRTACGIVDIDPIRYGLLFERFLNPGRREMPDIDMDFDSRSRAEMIRYAAERYGADHVAQIITFSTIKARAAVRDAVAGARLPVRDGRPDRQAHAAAHHGPRHAAARPASSAVPSHEDGYKMAVELRDLYADGPRRAARHRRRPRPRGAAPPGRHPRRRRGDRPRAPHRVPARCSASPSPGATSPTRRSSPSTRCTASSGSAC